MQKQVNMFLDSGAYSAYMQGTEVDVDEYITFVQRNAEFIEYYACLDVIGDAVGTWQNQERMEAAGLTPVPVYHYGDPLKYLERAIAEYDFLALGGVAGVVVALKPRMSWCDRIWGDYLTDDEGYPVMKVHGFGFTATRLILRYPWYSVDSTSWQRTSSFGGILVPPKDLNGEYDFHQAPGVVYVSDESPRLQDGQHFDHLQGVKRVHVLRYIKDMGGDLHKARTDSYERARINLNYFRAVVESHNVTRFFRPETKGFFS